MSTFRQEMTIVLDSEPYKCQSRAMDHTAAEIMTAKEGGTIETRPVAHGFRVAFAVFRRCYPDSEYAQSFARFLEVLDEVEDSDAGPEEPAPLDPTPPAGGDSWP